MLAKKRKQETFFPLFLSDSRVQNSLEEVKNNEEEERQVIKKKIRKKRDCKAEGSGCMA